MKQKFLSQFIEEIRKIWRTLDSDLIERSQGLMEQLANAPSIEAWLPKIQGARESVELYRDPEYGFILLGHTEVKGLYRAPHNHGNGWVIYAVQEGQMEMRTYANLQSRLVRRDKYRVSKGQARAYLPGDIHDTRCVSESVLMLRLTSCDLKKEKQEGRIRQFEKL